MRPSSSTWRNHPEPERPAEPAAGTPEPGLFDEILARGPVRAVTSDQRLLRYLLEVEAALATVQGAVGLVPPPAVPVIVAACEPDRYDVGALAREAAGSGNPVVPLVRAIRAQVGGEAAQYVHFGATSQDILDTATMMVVRDALMVLVDALDRAAGDAARLARTHRDTPMAGRTLLQHALPTTFGLVAAGWLTALASAGELLLVELDEVPAVQLGGAVGTLDAYGAAGNDLVTRLAATLRLNRPVLPWHTDRTRIGMLAGALGTAAGALGKVARDVSLLAGSEIGEVREAAPGGSSAMPHKRNPVASVTALACAAQAPGLVSTLLSAMVHEHQRAAGAWHAEWRPLRELLRAAGSAAQWLSECLAGLAVDEQAMAANLAQLGRTAGLADPAGHLGAAGELVDLALARAESGERQ
jgi:3-carboxy-cis,cis-muconate cycloisomerase